MAKFLSTARLSLCALVIGVFFSFQSLGQDVYSGASGNYNVIQWYSNQARTVPFVGVPGLLQTLNIGNGHNVTIPNGTTASFAGIVVHDNGASGTLTLGTANPNTNSAITVTGDIVINNSGTFVVAGNNVGGNLHSITLNGDLINDNIFNLYANPNDRGELIFSGTGSKTIGGTGTTTTFYNLRANTLLGADINVENSFTVLNQLNFQANGLFVLDATSNITLGSGGTIVGANNNRYIQQDGSTSSGSQLIITNNGSVGAWATVWPIGTAAGGYTPADLTGAIATTPSLNSTLAIKTIQNPSIQGQMRRQFRLSVSGNANATTITNADFSYNVTADISSGDVISNYNTNWYLSVASGTWQTTTGTAPGGGTFIAPGTAQTLGNGTYYYAIGNSTGFTNVWYSYQNGVWSEPDVWTLDPSGTSLNNPLNQPPSAGDQVVILNGFTVTVDAPAGAITLSTTTIQGGAVLDMAGTTGHTLGVVDGSGLLRVNGVALPVGNYSAFTTTTGGTVEYYNTGGNLPTSQTTYNKLILSNSTGANITYVLQSNLTLNGTFELITTGAGAVAWQINNTSNTQRTIVLNDDLIVGTGGRVRVGSGNETGTPHNLTMYGNITNNGSIKFYDDTDTELDEDDYGLTYPTAGVDLHRNETQGNAVTVTFAGPANRTVTCNNTTDFYRLVLNKGTGQTNILTINSANTAFFRLFGPANIATTESGNSWEYISTNALSLINGTLELTGSINIPVLTVNTTGTGYFPIPRNAALWLNGNNVTVQITDSSPAAFTADKDGRILMSGLLRISAGTLNDGFSKGLGSQDGGTYWQEGGTVNCWQFRPRAVGTGIFSYIQTGGTLNVGYGYATSGGKIDTYEEDYMRFDLNSPNSTFQMSGNAVLNVAKPTNTNGGSGGLFYIGSSSENFNVTGGTVNLYAGPETATAYEAYVNTTAPLYNVNIYEEAATTQTVQLQTNSLVVLNDLTIHTGNTPSFITNNFNVTVGGNFDIESNTTFAPGTGTVTFNGSGAQTWTLNGAITSLANMVVAKSAGTTLTLAGANNLPNITGSLTLTSGTLNDGGKIISLTSTAVLTNNAVHTGTGAINYASTAATMLGSNGTFGNFTLTTDGQLATSGAQTITGTLRLVNANSMFNIGAHSLTVLGNLYSNAAPGTATSFTSTKRIQTNGVHNAGGFTRQGAAGDIIFPVGTGTSHTPAIINVVATTHGTVTVRAVSSEHPNVTTTGQGVRYYWRVTSSGYSGITSVTHKSYNYGTATEDNPTANYRSARFDRSTLTWSTNNATFNATAVPPIPNFNTGTGWTGVTGDQLDGEYTVGNLAAFGAVTVYYSRASSAWNVNSTWSTDNVLKHGGAAASSNPTSCPTCPVVIGDGATNNHTVTTVAASTCGSLTLSAGSVLDCGTFTGHNFGTSTGGTVSGTGTLRIGAVGAGVANMFPAGDFTNFLGTTGGTVEWYGATKTIPATGPAPQNLSLATYYNLVVNPNAGATITLPASNLTVYNNFTEGNAAGFTGTAVTNGSRTLVVTNDLTVTRGTFSFSNANPSVTTLTVGNTTSIANGATMSAASGGTANINTLTTPGSIVNNGTLDFNNNAVVNITFTGNNDVTFSGTGATTDVRLVTVNKGTSQTPVVNCTVSGFTATQSGWLTLTNGTFHWNNPAAVTISSASATYSIPATAKLQASQGTVTVLSGNNTAADLRLSGTLQVSGGTVNIGTPANVIDNDIEYSSAGFPSIVVSAGALNVNGSIRRSTSTITGSLVYNQSGGTVLVEGEASNNTRGVFEIDANPGSRFTLTGTSSLIVERQTGGTGYADLFLNPEISNVSATSTISVGRATANTQTNFRVNVAPTIGNFTVRNGAGSNPQTVNMFSSPMVLAGTLSILSPSVLVTNSLDVTIAGDLNITGTGVYTGGTNTTTFNGTGPQAGALSAGSTFTNMTINKTAGTTLTLSGTSPTITNLNILNGILNVGALNLTVTGNIVNNSSQTGAGTIQMAGGAGVTSHNITSSGGSFTNLTLAGTATTKTVTVSGDMSILGVLNFASTNRYLNIGSGQLTFGPASSVTNAGNTAFIRTNGSDSDLGVVKTWAVGAGTFTYPIGTVTNYTPVTFNLNVTTAGNINVIPVNDRHPTANPSGEQILNYYWIVNRGSIVYTATGSHVYGYPTALLGGSGGTLRAAYLDIASATPGWITTGHGGTATTTAMTYTNLLNTNLPTTGNTFHYAVGTNTSGLATLPNPIIPVYSRLADASVANPNVGGDWNNTNSWTLSSDGMGAPWGSIPFGNSVVILPNSRINITQSGRKTFINQIDGLLVIPSDKVGHSFGILRGTGTLRTTTNTFPAGNYTAFVATGGGTIEYVAPMTMNNRTTYNNLSVIGTGAVTMTNTDLTLNGSVNIGAGATLNNAANNRNISMAGSWTKAATGSFNTGTGTVTFTGATASTVNGSTTFNNLAINKTGGATVTLAGTGTTTVNNGFTLTNGFLVTSATHMLSLPLAGTITGGSATSFIAGPVRKVVAAGGTLSLPLGSVSANRYRPAVIANTTAQDTWTSEYVGADPTTGGYNNRAFNDANIQKVSMFEYWLISRAGATVADFTITYNTGSYIPNATNIGTVANLRVVRWDGTQWDLPPGAGTHSQSGTDITGTVTVTNVTNFSPFTFGSLDEDSPLPVKWGPFDARWAGEGVALRWVTLQEIKNDHFEIERSEDGEDFYAIGFMNGQGDSDLKHEYKYFDSEASKSRYHYYRIKQVDFDGNFEYSRVVVVAPIGDGGRFWVTYPNPLEQQQTFTLEQVDAADGAVDVILYSSQGVIAYEASGTISQISTQLDKKLHNSGSGVYLLKVTNGLITETFKIVRH